MASKAAVEALPVMLSAVPCTMTPFLYQTRTLGSLHWARGRSAVRRQLCQCRRHFSGTITQRVVNNERVEKTATGATPTNEHKGPIIRRTTVMRGSEPQFSGDFYGHNNGYQSVAGKAQKEARRSIVRRVYQPEEATRNESQIPWDTTEMMDNDFNEVKSSDLYGAQDDIFDDENEIDAWTRTFDQSQDRQTTITPSERAAFETIFENIRNKTKNAQRYHAYGEASSDPASKERAMSRLEGILGNAMTADIPRTRDEKEIVVNRYPPSLRALAAKAVGLDFDESHFEETAKEEEEALDNDQLEELRKPIREGVEAKMRAAETDFALWDVMEEEVFPLIAKLGLGGAEKEKPATKRGKKPPKTLKTKSSKSTLPSEDNHSSQFQPILHEGQVISPLAFYGPLYPSYLLLGLRLLDRSFVRPSPLTLSILPKIKSLGLISHVLGATTQLYNELLIIHWYRLDDFRGVLNLLSEMEQFGLNFNRETLDIIDDITRMQGRILRGDRGPTLKALWSLAEFAPGKFGYWQKKITKMLNEKEDPGARLSY